MFDLHPVLPARASGRSNLPTTGTGIGMTRSDVARAVPTWTTENPPRGTMPAKLGARVPHQGPFLQIARETTVDELGPLRRGWGGCWRGWGRWNPRQAFRTEHNHKVVFDPAGPDGRMRCRSTLIRPFVEHAGEPGRAPLARCLDHRCGVLADVRRTDVRRCALSLELSALVLALAGCVTLNIPRTGEMVTRLGEGDIYRGTYRPARGASPDRLTATSPASEAIPAWAMRHAILADLIGPHGRIQCWFGLARPAIGVLGGGRGQCRLPDGSAVASGFRAQLYSEQMLSDAGD